ncbi:MAG TPA: hypothetical protein VNZ43_03465 [Sphingomonadaceae bacterium]|jgi:hypothetical protein|nr:hypothetical protein [Sphingomonadaceae bacterium]
MTTSDSPSQPSCPFCRAPWTDAMLEQFESYSSGTSCSCCAGPEVVEEHHDHAPSVPVEDLCCAACGRAIYLKPRSPSLAAAGKAE